MILMPSVCNQSLVYLLFLTTFILHRLCEAKESKINRKAKDQLEFIFQYYRLWKFYPRQFTGLRKYKVRLYSKASGLHLRILGRHEIDCSGTMNKPDSILVIETVSFGVIKIRGEKSGLYLCMNKKGHLVGRKIPKAPRCLFIVEDDHPRAYKRYVSLAFKKYRIAFNKNGRPRTASRVPDREHRSVLFVEKQLYNEPAGSSMRTRRHGLRRQEQRKVDPCIEANKYLLSEDWLHLWKDYCEKRKKEALKRSGLTNR